MRDGHCADHWEPQSQAMRTSNIPVIPWYSVTLARYL